MGLDGVEIILELERRFEIEIPDQALAGVDTVQDLSNTVWGLADAQRWPSSTAVMQQVTDVIAEQMSRDSDAISPRDRLTEDIGID